MLWANYMVWGVTRGFTDVMSMDVVILDGKRLKRLSGSGSEKLVLIGDIQQYRQCRKSIIDTVPVVYAHRVEKAKCMFHDRGELLYSRKLHKTRNPLETHNLYS